MFVTVFGQKGGVAKTCTSVHLAAIWSNQYQSVVLVDADRNRSASAYGARGLLNFEVAPIEAAAKATRYAEVVVTDGQASSSQEEIKNLVDGADVIILPTAAQTRSLELTLEMAEHLKQFKVPFAALLVKVDSRKAKAAREIRQALDAAGLSVLRAQIPLLAAFGKAENAGVTVDQAVSAAGKSDPRRMIGWHAYSKACEEIAELVPQRTNVIPMHPIGWDTTPLEDRRAA